MMRTDQKKLSSSLKILLLAAILCCLLIAAAAPTLAGATIHITDESGFSGANDGDTLILDNDIVITSVPLEIDKAITLDLNGHDLSCSTSSAITSDTGGLINLLADGIFIKNGSISLTQNAPASTFFAIFTDKEVSFRNVTFNIENTGSTKRTYAIADRGTVTLSETTFNMVSSKPSFCYEARLPGMFTLNLKGMLESDFNLSNDSTAIINELPADPPEPPPLPPEPPLTPEPPLPPLASPSDTPEPPTEPEGPAAPETPTGPGSPGTIIIDDVTPKHSTEKRNVIITEPLPRETLASEPGTEAETHSWQKINGKWTYCGEVNDGK